MGKKAVDPTVSEMAERARKWIASADGRRTVADIGRRSTEVAAKLREDQRVDTVTLCERVAL